MTTQAIDLLRQAIAFYKEGSGEDSSAIRDSLTDICHIWEEMTGEPSVVQGYPHSKKDIHGMFDDAYDVYYDESKAKERQHLNEIPFDQLPLHLEDHIYFEENNDIIEMRLREGL